MPCSVSGSQQASLSSLDLVFLFSALDLLVMWLKEGRYDFCALPFALKTHLTLEDSEAIDRIPESFKQNGRQPALSHAPQLPSSPLSGTLNQLYQELKGLNEVLRHTESHLVKVVGENPQVSRTLSVACNANIPPFFSPITSHRSHSLICCQS